MAGGLNTYGYVEGNPLGYVDILGQSIFSDIGKGAKSYFNGIYGFARFSLRRSGVFGDCEKRKTSVEGIILAEAINLYFSNDKVKNGVQKFGFGYIKRHPGVVAGRLGTTVVVGVGLSRAGIVGTGLAASLTVASYYGNLRNAAELGVNDPVELAKILLGKDDNASQLPSLLELYKNRNNDCACKMNRR